jgi:hypothetical protein
MNCKRHGRRRSWPKFKLLLGYLVTGTEDGASVIYIHQELIRRRLFTSFSLKSVKSTGGTD